MGCTTRLTTSNYWNNVWKMCRGVYWATNYVTSTKAEINMSRASDGSSKERHYFRSGETASFSGGKFIVKILNVGHGYATIEVWEKHELEPDMTKPQIISNHSDKLGYTAGDIIKSECVIKNIGGAGTVYLTVGLGYIDSSKMIFLTGFPTTDQLYLNYNQSYTFKEDVKVDITDYYRQQGIGWAYLQQQMYLFFLAGHKVNGDMIWDAERHIKIYLDEPEGFTDPTSLDESIIGDIPEIIEDALPAFGGLGGLGGVLDEIKPDAKDAVDWVIDKITPEPKEPEEQPDLMPFIYIGFAGLVGYLLVRSRS